MTPKPTTIILVLTLLLPIVPSDVSAAVFVRKGALLGGWRQIKDLNAQEVQDAAQFAVAEHNKEVGSDLEYQKLVNGETQVVSGTNYRLVIETRDGDVSGTYEAVVWVKPWTHYCNLSYFRKFAG